MLDKHLIAKTEPKARVENTLLWKDIRVTVLGERLFRLEQDIDGTFCDEATQSVWFRNLPKVHYTADIQETCLKVCTDKAVLTVKADLMRSTVALDGKRVTLADVKPLDGGYRTLDGCDGSVQLRSNGSREKIKKLEDGVVSRCGVGILNDTDSLILGQDGRICLRDDDDLDIYVFAHGTNYREAICDLYRISGKVPMIPRYALGNWWSRYHAYSDVEYLHVLDSLSDRDIPLTVATIDMDWHWSNTLDEKKQITQSGKNDELHGGNNGWTGYSWNTDLFPDYKGFLKEIQKRNLKITLNLHPADGVRYFEDQYDQMARAVGVDPNSEARIPFDFTSDDFINAYFKILHKPYEEDGVEFWWIDWQQGKLSATPGLDPLWSLNHYHTLDNAISHAPLILSRYCGIGSHRYPLGFSGDTLVTWDTLKFMPYFTSTATNAGYTWWSHDIGGHMNGFKDDELYVRFVQFGVFSPINRLHCSNDATVTKEPNVYMNGSGLIAEEFLRLRHKMIPFLYTASYETHENGKALIEPMYYAYPDCEEAYRCKGQYLFGGSFIVAPITSPSDRKGMSLKRVWLPQGHWTDIFTGDEYEGGRWIETVRWLDSLPVLARAGSFMVLDGRKHTNSIENPDTLQVLVFNGNGQYHLYEDHGTDCTETCFCSALQDGVQRVELFTRGCQNSVGEKSYRFEFRNISRGQVHVYEDGEEISVATDIGETLAVLLTNVSPKKHYRIEVAFTRNAREYRNARLLYSLMRIQGENSFKRKWYARMCEYDDDRCRASIESKRELTQNEKKRLQESW